METIIKEESVFSEIMYKQRGLELEEILLSVTPKHILLKNKENETKIALDDVIGATVHPISFKKVRFCLPSTKNVNTDAFYSLNIHLHVNPTSQSYFSLSRFRSQEQEYSFYIFQEETASVWRNFLLHAANNPIFSEIATLHKTPADFLPFQRRLLVFINPKSGKGNAPETWKVAKEILSKAGCEFTEVLTTHAEHAKEYVQQAQSSDLKKYDGFVTVSGDGLPHEVINGIMTRTDWEEINKIPIGAIPGGSGNALIASLLSKTKRPYCLESACYLIIKGKTIKSDLTVIERGNGPKIYSFLHFLWGLLAYVDFESERCRYLGGLRFEVFGVYAVLKNAKFRAKMTYTSADTALPALTEEISGEEWEKIEDDFTYFNLHKLPYMASDAVGASVADFQDGYNHFLTLRGEFCTRKKLVKTWTHLYGTLFDGEEPKEETGLFYKKVKAFRLEPTSEGPNDNYYYSIDGERYTAGRIQGKVQEKAITFFV